MASTSRGTPPGWTSRRRPLLLGAAAAAAALLTGCTADGDGAAPSTTPAPPVPTPTPTPVPTPTPTPTPTLSTVPAWQAGPGEVQPEIKLAATRFVELVGTWGLGEGDLEGAQARLGAEGIDPALAERSSDLRDDLAVAASVTVGYPQYGGLTPTAASVMITTTQDLLLSSGDRTSRQSTADVRLGRAGPESPWTVTALSPDRGAPSSGQVSAAGQQVLDNPNLRLPAAAVRDVEQGRVDDGLLAILDGLSRDHVLDVQVFETGHPTNVFATGRPSRHSVGRAFDVWRIDDRPVADPSTPPELIEAVMRQASALGATEVGGPVDLDGGGTSFFSDQVHQDHLHVGLGPGRPSGQP